MFSKRVCTGFEIYFCLHRGVRDGEENDFRYWSRLPRLPQSDCVGRLNFLRGEYKLVKCTPRVHRFTGTVDGPTLLLLSSLLLLLILHSNHHRVYYYIGKLQEKNPQNRNKHLQNELSTPDRLTDG